MKIPFLALLKTLFDEENCENCAYSKKKSSMNMVCICKDSKNFRKSMFKDNYCDEWVDAG